MRSCRESTIAEPNPDRGLRGDFLKITITISTKMLGDLKFLGLHRRANGRKDTDISSLIREAAANLLRKEAWNPVRFGTRETSPMRMRER